MHPRAIIEQTSPLNQSSSAKLTILEDFQGYWLISDLILKKSEKFISNQADIPNEIHYEKSPFLEKRISLLIFP